MSKRKRLWRRLLILCTIAMAFVLLAGCSAVRGSDGITSIEQLNDPGVTIGVSSDTAEYRLVQKELPKAKIKYFREETSAYTAVSQGKIDAYVFNKLSMETAVHSGVKNVRILDESLGENNISGVAFSPVTKIPNLEEKVNTFLREIKADGTLEDMKQRWLIRHEEEMPEIPLPETSDIHLVVGTTGANMPFTYFIGTEVSGYDIELARRFAAWLGATMEFKIYDYDGIIAAAQSGSIDCIFANLFMTPERTEALRFSDPTFVGEVGVMVQDLSDSTAPETITDFSDLAGKRVSMLTGAPFEELVLSKAPDVGEFTYFNNNPDMLLALESGKTDVVLTNNAIADLAVNRNDQFVLFPQSLKDGVFGFAFPKGDPTVEDWQVAYDSIPEETKTALWEKWTGSADEAKVLPEQDWPGLNGTVEAAVCDTLEPMSYAGEGGELVGFDEEMILLMAKELDVHVEFTGMEFAAILSAVQSGKAQIGAGSIIDTEERRQTVDFVDYYPAAFVLVVRDEAAAGGAGEEVGFAGSLKESFQKTFLRENRWKLFLRGIETTLLIVVLSILLGTALGFGVFMLCRNGNPVANLITRFCVWLVRGMPAVVLLMILFYIIFGNVKISGTAVSVISFTLVFGANVFSMIKAGVGAVGNGQLEAAYSLGYTNRRAFYRVILPQAVPHFMPAYKGAVTEIIKATAIVGYVAVQDLTKMGDIVRSRTFEAFFPLIAVAIIYFILAAVLTFFVNRAELRLDPRLRKQKRMRKEAGTK